LVFNNFLFKYYQLYRKTARDKNHLFSSHRTLRIFFRIFYQLFYCIFLFLSTWENTVLKNSEKILKKFLKLYEKKINDFCFLYFFCKVSSIWVKNYPRPIFWQFLVINILLTITKIVKWQRTFRLSLVRSIYTKAVGKNFRDILYIETMLNSIFLKALIEVLTYIEFSQCCISSIAIAIQCSL